VCEKQEETILKSQNYTRTTTTTTYQFVDTLLDQYNNGYNTDNRLRHNPHILPLLAVVVLVPGVVLVVVAVVGIAVAVGVTLSSGILREVQRHAGSSLPNEYYEGIPSFCSR
jgi:hypothetical protein